MKRSKLILPLMAFICAIGMSFATSEISDPDYDYIDLGTTTLMIDEVDCGTGDENCTVQREEEGPVYQVFDDENLSVGITTLDRTLS
ncbi:DUF6520 family protein [Zunongwangia sp. SCSIO 43204]|uniref:DUF6520 family protein n=1 Tax=Zunongwangia sp. SCSIO 43204 TaxID=2779359 RepID=UPI0021047BA5|nr:DUF6520 family protein [Zunongwangia sp. SCSIO 43204]